MTKVNLAVVAAGLLALVAWTVRKSPAAKAPLLTLVHVVPSEAIVQFASGVAPSSTVNVHRAGVAEPAPIRTLRLLTVPLRGIGPYSNKVPLFVAAVALAL
jgi:hypothetical protein